MGQLFASFIKYVKICNKHTRRYVSKILSSQHYTEDSFATLKMSDLPFLRKKFCQIKRKHGLLGICKHHIRIQTSFRPIVTQGSTT